MSIINKIEQLLQQIQDRRNKADELWKRLNRSLEIQGLWPEAFEKGTVNTSVEGRVQVILNGLYKPSSLLFVIKRSDGVCKKFPFKDVPWDLLLDHCKRCGFDEDIVKAVTRVFDPRYKKENKNAMRCRT